MRLGISLMLLALLFAFGCGTGEPTSTPVQTVEAYIVAVKKKDIAMMKKLLSAASLKLHGEQAKAQNVSIDEIIERETLFPANQRVFKHRNQLIDGKNATVEVENSFGSFDTVYLVLEDGIWKIDKKGFSENIIDQNEEADNKLDDQLEKERQQTEMDLQDSEKPTPEGIDPTPNPTMDPIDPSNPQPGEQPNDAGAPPKTADG